MRRIESWSGALLLSTAILVLGSFPAFGQSPDAGRGIMFMTNWPSPAEREDMSHQVLPYVDTLVVSYTYDEVDDAPSLSMAMEWVPSGEAVIRGELRPLSEVDVRMVAVELEAGVYVDDAFVATMSVVVDSMMVGPSPDFVEINLPNLAWSNVFVDVPEQEAKSLFERGFELRDPQFTHVAFALFEETGEPTGDASSPDVRRHTSPRDVGVHGRSSRVYGVFDLFWLLGENRRVRGTAEGTPRGTAGRGALEDSPRSLLGLSPGSRSARSGGELSGGARGGDSGDGDSGGGAAGDRAARDGESGRETRGEDRDGDREDREGRRGILDLVAGGDDDEEDDDDDDDDTLVPYAIAAVGAAGLLAVAGGTIGYFGNVRHARYGVTSGFVRPGGGLLLQVGVNEALLTDADTPKHLLGRLLAFGHVLRGNLQPALGAGILATSRGSDVEIEPSISIGAVGRARALIFYGGYDVVQNGLEAGVALNIRALGIW